MSRRVYVDSAEFSSTSTVIEMFCREFSLHISTIVLPTA